MTQGFGFAGGDPDKESNPLAGLGEMLQSIGRLLAQSSSGEPTALTAATLRQMASPSMPSHRIVDQKVVAATAAAGELANIWLDESSDLPAGPTPLHAWSPQEWLEVTAAGWVSCTQPVISSTARASSEVLNLAGEGEQPSHDSDSSSDTPRGLPFGLPAGFSLGSGMGAGAGTGMPEQLRALATHMTTTMLQQQLAQTVSTLSGEVTSLSDVPFDLATGFSALLPHAIETFAEGLELPKDQVLLWCALRENARARLFAARPWLPKSLADAILTHADNLHIDTEAIKTAMETLDPSDPSSLQDAVSSGALEPKARGAGIAAAHRLEATYSLIEGWVDCVVKQAGSDRLPSYTALAEAWQRRRATSSPAQQTLTSLLGLELSAKRVRGAAGLWDHIGTKYGIAVRDALWSHPDMLPTSDDLTDPTDFLAALATEQEGPATEGLS